MPPVLLEMMLRGAAISLFILLAMLFGREARRSQTARLGMALTLGGACYVALIAVDGSGSWVWWRAPLHLGSLATPGLFWLFAASWFDDDWELRTWHLALIAVLVTVGATANYLYWVQNVEWFGIAIGWRLGSFVAIALALRAALKGRDADLVEARRRMRLIICFIVAAAILWIVMSELWVRQWPPPAAWRLANAAGMLALALGTAAAIVGWRDPSLIAPPPKPVQDSRTGPDETELLQRLDEVMARERLYRQDGLTIAAVAGRLGVPEYRLRRAINKGLGARNFNSYLNGLRLREVEAALADPAQREVPILTIALDAGFGSLAPFNRAFRDAQGCTPTEFRARHMAG
jgi:AraC-like DNA-binding protein